MTALLLAGLAFACAGLAGLFAYLEHRLHRADRRGGRVLDFLFVMAVIGAATFALQLIVDVLSW